MPNGPRLLSKNLTKFLMALYMPILLLAIASCQGFQQPEVVKEGSAGQVEEGKEAKQLDPSKELEKQLQDVTLSEKAAELPLFKDAGDFYRVGGKKKELYQSTKKVVVRFREGMRWETMSEIVSAEEALESLETAKQDEKYRLFVLNLKETVKPDQLEQPIHNLRGKAEVELTFPVYISKETGKELIIGNELIVKLKDGVTEEQLRQINAIHNVSIIRQLRGTSDQYILCINEPKRQNVLDVAEVYYNSKIVEWAEPNFISELDLSLDPNRK